MDDVYVKIDSWHIEGAEGGKTLCGEVVTDLNERAASFGNDKTCEICFRIQAEHAIHDEPVTA